MALEGAEFIERQVLFHGEQLMALGVERLGGAHAILHFKGIIGLMFGDDGHEIIHELLHVEIVGQQLALDFDLEGLLEEFSHARAEELAERLFIREQRIFAGGQQERAAHGHAVGIHFLRNAQSVRIVLGDDRATKKKARTSKEYPLMADVPEEVAQLAEQIRLDNDAFDALEGALKANKARLRELVLPAYFAELAT